MVGKVITVAQQKGGSGRTTVAAHLAVALSRLNGTTVALLDVDPQGSLGEWFEARERRLGERHTGIGFRTASGWGARREAMGLSRDYDIVVVDTPPNPISKRNQRSKPRASLPCRSSRHQGRITDAMIEAIMNLDADVAETRLGNRVAFAECMGDGSTVMEAAPSSKGAAEVFALAREISQHLTERLAA